MKRQAMTDWSRTPRRAVWLLLMLTGFIGISVIPGSTEAATVLTRISTQSASDYNSLPLTNIASAAPIVMLGMSVDEQLYIKAYTDYTDLDDDGLIDITYQNSFEYAGYFDPDLCYDYASSVYKAAAVASNHQCSSKWSGNFLNWLTMTRLDVVRYVLYGGRRSTDGTTQTILERASVPNDVHAWAKVYAGTDINLYTPFAHDASKPGLSFCNLSYNASDTDSATSTAPPLLRVARGKFSQWSATEVKQCLWSGTEYNRAENPNFNSDGLGSKDYTVRVEVCDPAAASSLREAFCRPYPVNASSPTSYKPAGLLQRFGEDGRLQFGLMSGSYSKPRSGGLLRRNVGKLAGNGSDPAVCTTGDEILLSTGQFCNTASGTEGILNTLNRLKLAKWSSAASVHTDCNTFGILNRGTGANALNNPGSGTQNCNSWGNPISELYAEMLRYLSNLTATSAFSGNDTAYIPGLPNPAWRDAYASTDYCAECNIVMLSTGLNSFDTDEIPTVPALGVTAEAATDLVGSNEGFNGQQTLIGRVGLTTLGADLATHSDICTAKSLDVLSNARGICPEIPSFEGGYHIAGLAYEAWTHDLRSDLSDRQRAQTYAIALAESLPSFRIPTSSGAVTIVPTCQANSDGSAVAASTGWRSCALGALSVGKQRATVAPNYVYGRSLASDGRSGSFLVSWEDSPWGNDRDVDVVEMLSFCVGSACSDDVNPPAGPDICWRSDSTADCNADGSLARVVGDSEVLVRSEVVSAFAGNALLVGFSVSGASGTGNNGIQRIVLRPGSKDDSLLTQTGDPAGNSAAWAKPKVLRFTPDSSAVRLLENPLFYAAKYGGFDYPVAAINPLPSAGTGSTTCTETSWDQVDNLTGARSPDCLPDNYFPVRNPSQLADRLTTVFNNILRRSGSGTAAAVVANARQGEGAIYQALYDGSRTDGSNRKVSWIGTLQALFIDSDGNLREDGNGDALLTETDYLTDPVVQVYFDSINRTTRFRRFSANPLTSPTAFTVIDDIDQLRTVWNARRALSAIPDVITQRNYSSLASTGRYLFSFADYNLNGTPQTGEIVPFTSANFGTGKYGMLNVNSTTSAASLINFTRGQEVSGLRSRTLDYDGNGTAEVMRLGDIVDSSPVTVAAPAEAYDLIYGDPTYATFFQRYRARRNVVYVGANDGMLHAFNGGFYDQATRGFRTTPAGSSGITAHPLGSELWGYVPFNLLPHLGWLADPRYGHVWMMDGSPRVFDARVFAIDADHPGGWGTVLVVGMRLGGGTVNMPSSGTTNRARFTSYGTALDALGATEMVTRSAYVIMDVTNPEVAPKLLAEFTDRSGQLAFTTSYPAVAAFSSVSPPGTVAGDKWYLAFGSGPTDLATGTSSQTARLFGIDLSLLVATPAVGTSATVVNGGVPYDLGMAAAGSFSGDPVVVDWDLNFRSNSLYFGTSGGNAAAPTGKLFKLDFFPTEYAATTPPPTEASASGSWTAPQVLLDTQRPVLAQPSVTQDQQGRRWVLSGTGRFLTVGDKSSNAGQALFGVIDNLPRSSTTGFNNLIDTSNAVVTTAGNVTGVSGVTTEDGLITAVTNAGGWRYNLAASASTSAERSVNRTFLLDQLFFDTSYTPSASLCTDDGSSRLFGLYFRTGAARASVPAFGTRSTVVNGNTVTEALGVLSLGAGLGTAPTLHIDNPTATGGGSVTVNIQTSNGSIVQQDARLTGSIRSAEIDWRETHPNAGPGGP